MKTIKIAALVFSVLVFSGEKSFVVKSVAEGAVTFQIFYDELSPHGSWVVYGNYGYVWIPSLGDGFLPYNTNGHWVYTDYGWMWASGYSWGWAPFHYGRWLHDDFYGWMWVPDYAWAPAWVVWGYYDHYYGWAPIAPGITVISGYRPPSYYWFYCPSRYITHVHVHRYVVTTGIPHDKVDIIDNYDSKGNYYYGPRKEAVEKASGKTVTKVEVVEKNAPAPTKVSGNRVEVFRPEVTKGKSAPSKVNEIEEVKPLNRSNMQERKTNDPVYDRKEEVTQPTRDNTTQEKKSVAPQNKGTDTDRKQEISPQQKVNPQQRTNPQQKVNPQQKINPQQRKNAPTQERKPPPQKQQPAPEQKKQKIKPQ